MVLVTNNKTVKPIKINPHLFHFFLFMITLGSPKLPKRIRTNPSNPTTGRNFVIDFQISKPIQYKYNTLIIFSIA